MKLSPRGITRLPRPCHNPHSRQKTAQIISVWIRPTTGHTGVVGKKSGFSRGPIPHHSPIRPINREKKAVARPLLHPLPLAPTFNWRARGRRRRQRRGVHPHRTAQGDFQPALAANSGRFWPTRSSDAPVGRQDKIVLTAGTASVPTSHLRAWGNKTVLWMGGGS